LPSEATRGAVHATWTLRPLRRFRLMSFRPFEVRILARNPILLERLRFDILCG